MQRRSNAVATFATSCQQKSVSFPTTSLMHELIVYRTAKSSLIFQCNDSSSRMRIEVQFLPCHLQAGDRLGVINGGKIEQGLLKGFTGLQIVEVALSRLHDPSWQSAMTLRPVSWLLSRPGTNPPGRLTWIEEPCMGHFLFRFDRFSIRQAECSTEIKTPLKVRKTGKFQKPIR